MQLPWRRAPRAALSSPLTVLVTVVAALLLSFVAGAAVLHSSSAGSAAISYQIGRNCEQNMAPTFRMQGQTISEATALMGTATTEGTKFGFTNRVGGVYSSVGDVNFNGIHPYGRIAYRDDAYDNLKVLQGGDRSGTWVPASIANAAHVKLGDRGMFGSLPPVTAIYQDLGDTPPEFWCTEKDEVVVNLLAGEGTSGAVVFVPTLRDLAKAYVPAHDADAKVSAESPDFLTTIHYRLTPVPATVSGAADVTDRGKRLIDDMKFAFIPTTPLNYYRDTPRLNYGNYFVKPVEVAGEAEAKVRASTLPLTLISLVVGLIGLAAVAVQWCQRRQAELRLLWSRGSGPAALGGRAVLELAGPLVLGSVLGTGAALLLRPWYAPPGALPGGTIPLTVLLVLAVTVAGLLVLGLTTALRTRQTLQGKGTGTPLGALVRFVPWELITAVLAFLAWLRLEGRPQTPKPGNALIEADATGLAFPLLVVVTVALVLTRLTRWALAVSHRRQLWRWPAGHLAMRRLAAATGSAIGILLVGILAVGTLTVGSGIADAQQDALDTKSGLLVGGNSSVNIAPQTGQNPVTLPKEIAEHSTVVGILAEPLRTTLVVDPATFTRGAWLGDRDPDGVQATLDSLATGDAKHALRVGHAPAGTVTVPEAGQVQTTASVASFPYIGNKTGYVITRAALPDIKDLVSYQLWSTMPLDQLIADLDAAGIGHNYSQTVGKALDGLPFLTVTWTFTFVAALGMVLAVVAAVALVLAVEVRRRQNAVSGALATRMGLRRRTLTASHVLELGSLAGLSTTAGCAAGLITTGVSVPLFDPAPWLRPIASIPDMAPLVLVIYLVTAAVVAMVSWTAVRSVRTAQVGELIRG